MVLPAMGSGAKGGDCGKGESPLPCRTTHGRPAAPGYTHQLPQRSPPLPRNPSNGGNLAIRGSGSGLPPHHKPEGGICGSSHAVAGQPIGLQRGQSHEAGSAYQATFGQPAPQTAQAQAVMELKLVNPGSLCYMHVVLISLLWQCGWGLSFRTVGDRLHPLLEALLRSRGSLRIQHLPPSQVLCDRWHAPHLQHDVAEFVTFVLHHCRPPAFAGEWATRRLISEGLVTGVASTRFCQCPRGTAYDYDHPSSTGALSAACTLRSSPEKV